MTLNRATFVPRPVHEMQRALHDFERFLHEEPRLPILVYCGLAHVQFETIHPFLDGNGRVGRLLIAFLLVHHGVLHRPLLYLSTFLKRRRAEYYDRLMAVRNEGNWEAWLRFFLRGVADTAEEATENARAIVRLQDEHRKLVQEHGLGLNELRLLDLLVQRPLVNAKLVVQQLDLTDVTASRLLGRLAELDILDEITGRSRNRIFRYSPYWALFQDPDASIIAAVPVQTTESTMGQ